MKKLTTEEFIDKAKEIHGDKYDYSLTKYMNGKSDIIIVCLKHGEFAQRGSSHLEGRGCNKCMRENRRNGLDKFLTKAKEKHGNKFDYSLITEYKSGRSYVSVICKEHGIFKITPYHHVNRGQGCGKCKSLGIDRFIKISNTIHDNKYDYSKSIYTNNKGKVNIICPIHGLFNQRVSDHINGGHGCSECTWDSLKLSTEEFIIKSNEKHNNKYLYIRDSINFKTNKDKVSIICLIHGKFQQRVNTHLNGSGCPICKESKGEKIITKYLLDNKIEYIPQKRFDDCKHINTLPFDFYLPDYNICIEFNGRQHYKPIDFFGGVESFKNQIIRDKIKIEYCRDKNIPLIIIKYNENHIKVLNELFNRISIIS